MSRAAVGLDRLLRRLAGAALATPPRATIALPAFPLAGPVLAAGPLRAPFFWGRFDVFERAGGGLAVLEYNCDKPVGQREIWASGDSPSPSRNPNRGARAAFRRGLLAAWNEHRAARGTTPGAGRRPRLAILVDPTHREELHLAYLFGREASRLGWEWDVVGPDNLGVEAGRAMAYGRPIDVVLRQYPTEFLHELPAMADLWGATRAGRLLWLNDPRAVISQAKSGFAYLWECVSRRRWLSRPEAALVERYVPPTGLASDPRWRERAAARREDWVIKPILGRYSEDVVLGPHCSAAEWEHALAGAAAHPGHHVIQAYVPAKRRWLPGPGGERGGYVNWGIYLTRGKPAGICPRFQPTPLTSEATTWWAPLRLRRPAPTPPIVRSPRAVRLPRGRRRSRSGPGRTWQGIADRAALAGYTNAWTDGLANFSLAAIVLAPAAWDEVHDATRRLGRAIGRVLAHLRGQPSLLTVLGIPSALAPLVAGAQPGSWSFLSRFDWARTVDGRWKLLEINSDTPAGLWEASIVAAEVERLHGAGKGPSASFWPAMTRTWREHAARVENALDRPLRVGVVGALAVPEDRDQMRAHARAAGLALPAAIIDVGRLADVQVREGAAWLHGERVDLLFRYHPLDWFDDPALAPLVALAEAGRLPMLPPPHVLIPQTKAFLALLHELLAQDFFPADDAAAIRAHVPRTVLDPARLRGRPYVVKPYLEREGRGVRFSEDLARRERRRLARADVVYQERLDLARVRLPIATAGGWRDEERTLVFGIFLAGEEIAGAYTRAGAAITGREAVFSAALVEAGPRLP